MNTSRGLVRLHWSVWAIAALLGCALTAVSGRYGYHRDELYFRLLGQHPAWGYVDQPPLTPLLGRASIAIFGDSPGGLRVAATVCAMVLVLLAGLLARELGGGTAAQALTAVGTATAAFPLIVGHALLTSSADIALWCAVILLATRALRRDDGRWWLAAGAVAGLALYNKHLVALLAIGLAAGLALVGPRTVFRDRWLWTGAALALVIGSPNLIYQATHGWPQLDMAQAVAETDGSESRIMFVPMQFLILGPPLVAVAVPGAIALWRDRVLRCWVVAYAVAAVLTLVSGGRGDYVAGFLVLFFAAGSVAVTAWVRMRPGWTRRTLVGAAVVVNAVVAAVIALPLIPVGTLGSTPVPAANEVARESVGWQRFADTVVDVYRALPASQRREAVVLTSNYGEAGALDAYADDRLPSVYSGQNQLYEYGPPPETARVAVVVRIDRELLREAFRTCERRASIDNGVDVDNEEQGEPVYVCTGRKASWRALWPRFHHLS